jgi:hypothetical protein
VSKVEPALTPAQWAKKEIADESSEGAFLSPDGRFLLFQDEVSGVDADAMRHGIAALALYGQPFGFTREDVHLLWKAAALKAWGTYPYPVPEADAYNALAARITALLPPDEGNP